MKKKEIQNPSFIALIVIIVIWSFYTYRHIREIDQIKLDSSLISLSYEDRIFTLTHTIKTLQNDKQGLIKSLTESEQYGNQLKGEKQLSDAKVTTLTKLVYTDPELLKKYSKVYFLSENYAPNVLLNVKSDFIIDKEKAVQVLDKINPYLTNLMSDAMRDKVDIKVLSGYRSFAYQKNLKSDYKIIYGAGTANQFSAEQGYSEHQLGSAIDFTTSEILGAEDAFQDSEAFDWLTKNAYKYGFIISYPKENKFYNYEPWHWRFVGKELAQRLHKDEKYFYEMDQRELDLYLIKLFD